jgi:predicted RNA-binding Zn-ribbon protein involved in translation (DUF1610 family)
MSDFTTDRERLISKLDAVLEADKRPMDFKCGDCGKQYIKMSTDDEWHICPGCKRSIKT